MSEAIPEQPKRMSIFDKYLSVWVALCMVVGIALGRTFPALTDTLRQLEFGTGSQINIPIAVLIWLMIVPMMMKIDFSAVVNAARKPKGLMVTLIVNWAIKPFTMFALGWLFFMVLYRPFIEPELAKQYLAGAIILGAAPCTAMVFVWSYLTHGDAGYTLVQVAVNDLVMLVLFAPIVGILIGVAGLELPFVVLLMSVLIFIVVPLTMGWILRSMLIRSYGREWFQTQFMPRLQPLAVTALLATLVFLFAFQADSILANPLHVGLIAVPLILQVYLIWAIGYAAMWLLRVPFAIAAPGSLIGASNFFELAVATAIALYGPSSGAALATVVGVLVEVPVMLSVCAACNATQPWFARNIDAGSVVSPEGIRDPS
jgi:ACR3 family arsenite transporter